MILLGVLIPVFQTTQAKSDEVRDSLEFRVALYDDATKAEIDALKASWKAIPHVASVALHQQGARRCDELDKDLGKRRAKELLAQLQPQPAAAQLRGQGRRRHQPRRGARQR